jgi:hypothetical protein
MTKLLSEREADEMANYGDVNTWSSDSDVDVQKAIEIPIMETIDKEDLAKSCAQRKPSNKHMNAVGKRVAKDFGKLGVLFGDVQSVEYESDDAAQEAPFYVVQYTDGDREDYDEA